MNSPFKNDIEVAKELLFRMKKIRCVEETIAARYSEGKMRCPTHLSTGQECVSAAAGLALRRTDFAVSGHRAHGHYIGKGGSVPRMLAEIYGKVTGCARGKGGSMHLIDESVGFMGSTAIVGGTIPIGVGLGLSIQLKKGSDQVSCVFLGDGAVEEGVFFEAANFAVLKKLPVIFICENNFYSVYSHLRVRQPEGRKICEMVEALGLKSSEGDGNDALDTYRKISTALTEIRGGGGPQFLEFTTYRWREHCGPNFDNHIGYRSEEEYLHWRALEPIKRLEDKLTRDQILSAYDLQKMDEMIVQDVQLAFEFADSSEFPQAEDIYTDLWA